MNPKTGEFHEETEYEETHGQPMPEGWPRFSLGEEVEIKGIPFIIQRINVSSIVLRPKITKPGHRAADVIRKVI